MRAGGGAAAAGQVGGNRADGDQHALLLGRHARHRQCHGRARQIEDGAHAAHVIPLTRGGHAQVILVLVVGADQLDAAAQHLLARVLDGQLGRNDRAGSRGLGIHARHVRQHAQAQWRLLGMCAHAEGAQQAQHRKVQFSHASLRC
ncbi:hypothetical protein SDC9_134294 [bioreactor metagenome]|uniref:Uncharacterized protein n=1 Tax=bioreactor metagenome TaxID=1076179 RepID=A0A645DCJ3_9ZZZZ